MAATTTSSSNFFHVEPRVRSPSNHGCAKLDGVAMWLMNGVANAFFASLQRCSCIRIATVDDQEDSNDVPLIFNDGNLRHHDHTVPAAGSSSWRKRSKGKKGMSAAFVDPEVMN
ncbi:hypothetical protein Ccrd_022975 [Cynara cardunculus var. scolymus]|uniref:Uncharacterized protein n=1 Tax=Cynara cardunculus var. scolymus TaxID=59895 RepID=A0A118JYL3_CYNCS|nr:hypothetical protein Ccrd_022975 [Cynara cardunculus var. scolymus]